MEKKLVSIDFYGYNVSVLLPGDELTGGNKHFKLKYNLEFAKDAGFTTLITMGGAYSNHIAATAAAGKKEGFKTIGIIRGEEPQLKSVTLQRAEQQGMQLIFVSRDLYRKFREEQGMISELYPKAYILPEGGSNKLAVKGCAEMLAGISMDFDTLAVAVGTGATLAGLVTALHPHQSALGIAVISNGEYIDEHITEWLEAYPSKGTYRLLHEYHCGGYARTSQELLDFVKEFNSMQPFKIEPIYTGKMFLALHKMITERKFRPGTRLLAVHTGGLQYLV